jgi:hypothetical protein
MNVRMNVRMEVRGTPSSCGIRLHRQRPVPVLPSSEARLGHPDDAFPDITTAQADVVWPGLTGCQGLDEGDLECCRRE